MDYAITLHKLAHLARQGDLAAFRQLQRELQRTMGPMVRRAVRREESPSRLFERIRSAALQLMRDEDADDAAPTQHLVDEVARSICEELFRPACRPAAPSGARETVRNW